MNTNLFSEFTGTNAEEWKAQILKDLKGTGFDQLTWHNPNGFEIHPFYTPDSFPGKPQPLFCHADWEICERVVVKDEGEANRFALSALMNGAGSLLFVVEKQPDLVILLKDISVEHIGLAFHFNYHETNFKIETFNRNLSAFFEKRDIQSQKINCSVFTDVIGNLAAKGTWYQSEVTDLDFQKVTMQEYMHYTVIASLYHNAGATQSFELACALSHGHEYLVRSCENNQKQGLPFRFHLSVGGDFFGEIAKLRALRKLWHLVAKEYLTKTDMYLHCETSLLNKSPFDVHMNILRTTTEGMSAVIGGCNSLTIHPFDYGPGCTDRLGGRVARNQQLIFKEESYLNKVADPVAGSYYVETLTDQIAAKAWEEFKQIENRGGFIKCLESNYIQDRIYKQAIAQIQDFREGKKILVGVNKYPDKTESQNSEVKKINSGYKRQMLNDLATIQPIVPVHLCDYLEKKNA